MASRLITSSLSRSASSSSSIASASCSRTTISATRGMGRRYASGGPHYHQPSGYLFGEKPTGGKRVKEDWENIYYLGMFGGIAFAAVVMVYKPNTSIQAWATEEAKRRMVERGDWEKIEYKSKA